MQVEMKVILAVNARSRLTSNAYAEVESQWDCNYVQCRAYSTNDPCAWYSSWVAFCCTAFYACYTSRNQILIWIFKEDIETECSKFGKVRHIYVDNCVLIIHKLPWVHSVPFTEDGLQEK